MLFFLLIIASVPIGDFASRVGGQDESAVKTMVTPFIALAAMNDGHL